MVNKELREAAVEVNTILSNSSTEILDRIPIKFRKLLKDIESDTYIFNYDNTKSLYEQNMKPKTRALIALIYRDYLCDSGERQVYIKHSRKIDEEIEKAKRELYNPDNLFKEKKIEIEENTYLIENQENFISKILKKINKALEILKNKIIRTKK